MAIREVVECDLCGEPDARTVTISTLEEAWDIDSCISCMAPFIALRPRPDHRFRITALPPQPGDAPRTPSEGS